MKASLTGMRRPRLAVAIGLIIGFALCVLLHVYGIPFVSQGPRFDGLGQAQTVQIRAHGDMLSQVPTVIVGVSEQQFEQVEMIAGVAGDGGMHFAVPAAYDQVLPLLSGQQKNQINQETVRMQRGSFLITTAGRYLCVGSC